jgi:hypothetical protein
MPGTDDDLSAEAVAGILAHQGRWPFLARMVRGEYDRRAAALTESQAVWRLELEAAPNDASLDVQTAFYVRMLTHEAEVDSLAYFLEQVDIESARMMLEGFW